MGKTTQTKLVLGSLMVVTVALWWAVWALPDGQLRVTVCDVGQGDAILARWKGDQILIDGGPDTSVENCLAKYVPFYDRTIEAVIMTHPQADHMNGLLGVIEKYKVKKFITVPAVNKTEGFKQLEKELADKNVDVQFVTSGNKIVVDKMVFDVVWPSAVYEQSHLRTDIPAEYGKWEQTDGTDLNRFAVVGNLTYGKFSMLLTGDADSPVDPAMMEGGLLRDIDVLKVPHHGSRTGMTQSWLQTARPELAIISVGAHNRYGHPSAEAIKLLSDLAIKILRTDQDGDVTVVSDGEKWWVQRGI